MERKRLRKHVIFSRSRLLGCFVFLQLQEIALIFLLSITDHLFSFEPAGDRRSHRRQSKGRELGVRVDYHGLPVEGEIARYLCRFARSWASFAAATSMIAMPTES